MITLGAHNEFRLASVQLESDGDFCKSVLLSLLATIVAAKFRERLRKQLGGDVDFLTSMLLANIKN